MEAFLELDNMTFSELRDKLTSNQHELPAPVISYMDGEILHVQSKKLFSGVPYFIIRISPDQTTENFHLGVRCSVASLSKNRITKLKTWSALQENIRCVLLILCMCVCV